MLVCSSLSAALICLLARSLGSAPRCSSSHLCSESDIQMEGARPTTELRPVPSAGLYILSRGASGSLWCIEQVRTAVVVRQALGMLLRAVCYVQGIDGSSVSVCRGST